MWRIVLFTFFLAFLPLCALTLKDQIQKGSVGDFIVTSQNKTYTLLLLRHIGETSIVIEEISIPEENFAAHSCSWKEWIDARAPNHTSWTAYEIDTKENKLIECFSYLRQSFLPVDDPKNFLAKLLSLSFEKTPDNKRKKIGPAPLHDEIDRRKLWTPPVMHAGQPISSQEISAWTGKWPDDKSLLAGCEIEIYLGKAPFPYWIEIKHPHYAFCIRSIDSGTNLTSPLPSIPHQTPLFVSSGNWEKEALTIFLRAPNYYRDFQLFAIDVSNRDLPPIPIPYSLSYLKELTVLEIEAKNLKQYLQEGHAYRWRICTSLPYSSQIESEQLFLY